MINHCYLIHYVLASERRLRRFLKIASSLLYFISNASIQLQKLAEIALHIYVSNFH
jgi:hypothetical protein